MESLFAKLYFTLQILSTEESGVEPLVGAEKAKELLNRPRSLKEVKSLAVAKTLLHNFCSQSQKQKEMWDEFESHAKEETERGGNAPVDWEEQFDKWEQVLSKESRNLDRFIEKHNELLNQRAGNMEKQYQWIQSIKDKLEM